MSKLLVIGIDGMDSLLLSRYEDLMPNFKRLKDLSQDVKMRSVFPPDSIPAWGSIYTGLNPAEHGVINFIDPNNVEVKIKFQDIYKNYVNKTFWDLASQRGKKVCILLPYSIYPPWPVNGAMVCRTLDVVDSKFPLKAFPENLFDEFELNRFNVNLFHGFPSKRNYDKFLTSCKNRTLQEAELCKTFLRNYDADLYFIYFSALDAVEHTFWNYCDENHPDYPGENQYQNAIRDFYCLMDGVVGSLLSEVDDDTIVVVLSDHGHGMRPTSLVNVNEFLRAKGYLTPNNLSKRSRGIIPQKEKVKKIVASLIGLFGVGNLGLKLVNKFSFVKDMLSTPNYIDWDRSQAYLSAISGIKSYSEGGIMVSSNVRADHYNRIRESIIDDLSNIRHPITGDKLIEWVSKREDLYQGEYIEKYPDVVFKLKAGYGVGWDIGASLIGKSNMSSFQPGSHLGDTPIFFVMPCHAPISLSQDISLMDVNKIISNLLFEG